MQAQGALGQQACSQKSGHALASKAQLQVLLVLLFFLGVALREGLELGIERGLQLPQMLCVLPESNVHAEKASGHMRLIIGYGEKSHEILYSDSWGLGHELKRMPVPDAWTITTGLATIEPL